MKQQESLFQCGFVVSIKKVYNFTTSSVLRKFEEG